MPFTDRQEFRAWLDRHHEYYADEPPRLSKICRKCDGALDPDVSKHECVPCLAEQFGTATVERWVADVVGGIVRTAGDPDALAQLFGEMLRFGRDVVSYHAPVPAAAD